MTSILLRVEAKDKHAYTEAAHEARMNLSDWMRQVLYDAAHKHSVVYAKTPAMPPTTTSPGKEAPLVTLERACPLWALNDSAEAAAARKKLFGSTPARQLSSKEADFNKLCDFEHQRFSPNGAPLYDQYGNPLNAE